MLFGARDDFAWYPRQLCDRQAVALAGRSRQNAVQEYDPLVMFGSVQVHVADQWLAFRQNGQLEVVRGEQGVGAQLGEAFCRSPGEGQTIEGAGPAADFVHQHQAAVGRVVQDIGCFAHFHHERRASARQIIAGADPGEYPVYQ